MNADQSLAVIMAIEGYYTEMPDTKSHLFRAALAEHEYGMVIEAVHRLARASKWAPTLAEILAETREVQRERAFAGRPELPDVTWTPEEEAAARDAAMASYREFVASHPPSFLDDAMGDLGASSAPSADAESTGEEQGEGDS